MLARLFLIFVPIFAAMLIGVVVVHVVVAHIAQAIP